MDRWAFNVVCLFEGKPTALDGHCLYRCCAANRILILSPSPCDGNAPAGIYRRCCLVLNQLRDYVHDPWYHRAYPNKDRHCPDKCNHVG